MHIERASEAVRFLKGNVQPIVEEGFVLFLDNSFDCHHAARVQGDFDHVDFPIQTIATLALSAGSQKVIIAHSHPAGPTNPSTDDIATYIETKEYLKHFGIELLDSLVLDIRGNFTSIKLYTSSKVDLNDYARATTPARDKH